MSSDTPETDRIARLLENLDEWIDDSLRNSKPIGITLCAARSTITDHRARITELWDALETLRRERDEANRLICATYDALTPDGCDLPPSGINSMPDKVNAILAERDEAREDLEFRRELYNVQEEFLKAARRDLAEAQIGCLERARLLSMSSEREAKLIYERDEAIESRKRWEKAAFDLFDLCEERRGK